MPAPILSLVAPAHSALIPVELQVREALSNPFAMQLRVQSQQLVDLPGLVDQPLSLLLQIGAQSRYFHGSVTAAKAIGSLSAPYQFEFSLAPALARLDNGQSFQIFKQKSLLDICLQLLSAHKITHQVKVQASFAKLDYFVQYHESPLNFLHRIIAQAGLCYYFEHSAKQSMLILSDSVLRKKQANFNIPLQAQPLPNVAQLYQLQQQVALQTNAVAARSFNANTPGMPVNLAQQAQAQQALWLEKYYYPESPANADQAAKRAAILAQQISVNHHYFKGESNHILLAPGVVFTAADNNTQLNVLSIKHHISDYTQVPHSHSQAEQSYVNTFTATIKALNMIDAKNYIQPKVAGLQTARVITHNKVVDAQASAAITLRFPWCDERSIPVRSAHAGANQGFGQQFLPRQHAEVTVHYANGQPQQPLIAGQLYNATHATPYSAQTQPWLSGIRSQTFNGKDPNSSNEIQFNDKANQEQLLLRASKDFTHAVGNDYQHKVTNNYHKVVKQGDQITRITNRERTICAKSIVIKHGASFIAMSDSGIHFQGSTIALLAAGNGATQPAARLGDFQKCPKYKDIVLPHKGGKILQGSSNVLINGKAAARANDPVDCQHSNTTIKQGAPGVLINGRPLARVKDETHHGGVIKQGSGNVIVGQAASVPLPSQSPPRTYWSNEDMHSMSEFNEEKDSVEGLHIHVEQQGAAT